MVLPVKKMIPAGAGEVAFRWPMKSEESGCRSVGTLVKAMSPSGCHGFAGSFGVAGYAHLFQPHRPFTKISHALIFIASPLSRSVDLTVSVAAGLKRKLSQQVCYADLAVGKPHQTKENR